MPRSHMRQGTGAMGIGSSNPRVSGIENSDFDPRSRSDCGLPGVVELKSSGRLMICQAQSGIVESVAYATAQAGQSSWPLVITTADNVLVTPAR